MIHYCTYFDRNYLTRAIALHRSLVRHSPEFTLWALCFDEDARRAIDALDLEGVRPIRLSELETADPQLLAIKGTRSTVEYYFTCSPILPLHVLRLDPQIDSVTYLDADLLFYSSPQPIFDEMGDGSVLIIPHRFPEQLRHLEVHGVFNVGLLVFRNDTRGRAVLDKWRTQCLEWCFDRAEDGRFADQAYLDDWPSKPGVIVSQNLGAGLAPWNFMRYQIDLSSDAPHVDGWPLVFYHFQGVKEIRPHLWDIRLDPYGARMSRVLRSSLYGGYLRALESAGRMLQERGLSDLVRGGSLRRLDASWREVAQRVKARQLILSIRGARR